MSSLWKTRRKRMDLLWAIGEEATPCCRANSKADCYFEKTPPLGLATMAPAETTCSSLPAGVGLPQPSTPARRATSLRPTQVARQLRMSRRFDRLEG